MNAIKKKKNRYTNSGMGMDIGRNGFEYPILFMGISFHSVSFVHFHIYKYPYLPHVLCVQVQFSRVPANR